MLMDWLKLVIPCLVLVVYPATEVVGQSACPAPTSCACLNEIIDCSYRQLTHVPTFRQSHQYNFPTIYVSLYGNKISTIPGNAFSALQSTGGKEIIFVFTNNQIQSVNENAFAGIENRIAKIDVENNLLTSIPRAFGKLPKLHTLLMRGNSLQTLGLTPGQAMSQSLHTFEFNANNFNTWPSDLAILSQVETLNIDEIPFSKLPTDAFKGLMSSLTSLSISDSKLASIPEAICSLKVLKVLQVRHNKRVNISPGSTICPNAMTTVETVNFHDNDLSGFPDFFHSFPRAKSLTVSGNLDLFFIPSELVKTNFVLSELNLEKNHFESIPAAIQNLVKLTKLNLNDNFIRVIQGSSFDALQELTSLSLSRNPVSYISTSSLTGLRSLVSLDLDGTNLQSIPRAVTSLPKLTSLNLEKSNMQCTCLLAEDKDWTEGKDVSIRGDCKNTNMRIETYVLHYLKNCPQ